MQDLYKISLASNIDGEEITSAPIFTNHPTVAATIKTTIEAVENEKVNPEDTTIEVIVERLKLVESMDDYLSLSKSKPVLMELEKLDDQSIDFLADLKPGQLEALVQEVKAKRNETAEKAKEAKV